MFSCMNVLSLIYIPKGHSSKKDTTGSYTRILKMLLLHKSLVIFLKLFRSQQFILPNAQQRNMDIPKFNLCLAHFLERF